jgi:hypothetical protein
MTLTIVNVPSVVMTSLQCCGLFEHFGINVT